MTGSTGSSGSRLAGRVALVTGASRGLGRAIAVAFAGEGAAVAVTARTESVWDDRLPGTVHDTVAEIAGSGGRAVAIAADLSNEGDVERLVEEARDRLGPIDLLVNNAALTVPGRPPPPGAAARPAPSAPAGGPARPAPGRPFRNGFLDFPLKGYRLHFEVGVFAAYRLMQLVIPDMVAAGRGAIVNISSYASSVPGEGPYEHPGTPTGHAYGGNKAALEHLTRAVAYEVAGLGIAVNALSPSEPVITPGNLVAAPGTVNWASPEAFAEATVLLALATPDTLTGSIAWSEDVLHPELGRRGWLGEPLGR